MVGGPRCDDVGVLVRESPRCGDKSTEVLVDHGQAEGQVPALHEFYRPHFHRGRVDDLTLLDRSLQTWLSDYNHHRPNHGAYMAGVSPRTGPVTRSTLVPGAAPRAREMPEVAGASFRSRVLRDNAVFEDAPHLDRRLV